ncbi:MAG: DUF423 domain-containing protein [Gammaproteobacteria bacterium]|nr:MAG: DUF423 domain-containing protein [Gammaproteobacteria bacterium]
MNLYSKIFLVAGCLFLASAGALSAYGFHGLAGKVGAGELEAWQWAVQMQYYHGLGLVLTGALGARLGGWAWLGAGALMIAGIVVFSCLIYAQTLGAPEAIGEIVPLGGSAFMLSWLLLAIAVIQAARR